MARHRIRVDRLIGPPGTPDALQTKGRGAPETMWAMFSRRTRSQTSADRRAPVPLQPNNLRIPVMPNQCIPGPRVFGIMLTAQAFCIHDKGDGVMPKNCAHP